MNPLNPLNRTVTRRIIIHPPSFISSGFMSKGAQIPVPEIPVQRLNPLVPHPGTKVAIVSSRKVAVVRSKEGFICEEDRVAAVRGRGSPR